MERKLKRKDADAVRRTIAFERLSEKAEQERLQRLRNRRRVKASLEHPEGLRLVVQEPLDSSDHGSFLV